MKYKPKPIDTSGVKLPRGLRKLTEELAQNNHDLWAKQRLSEGWTYGPNRDDHKKTHPDLIPYSDLSDSEKQYDRITAIEGLRAIIALGYQIEPPSTKPPQNKDYPHRAIEEMVRRLRDPEQLDVQALLEMGSLLGAEYYAGSPKVYALLGDRTLRAGEPLLAYDVISTGLGHWPKNVRLRQLQGLALARSHAAERANQVLTRLYADGKIDGETLGILARTHKDLSALAATAGKRQIELGKAHDYYIEGYKRAVSSQKRGWRDDALYNGVNAATTALLRKKRPLAKELAGKVHNICTENLKKKKDDYWTLATLGEAALILGDFEEAEARYTKAGELGREKYGDLSSTRGQARNLLAFMGKNPNLFDHCFHIPKVAVFAGHMVDQPGRDRPRFPPSMVKKARKEMAHRLEQLDVRIGFSSAACGGDILFLEEMIRRGGEINVILPFEKEAFCKTSVDIIPGMAWKRRFNRVLKQAKSVVTASDHRFSGNNVAYQYTNLLQHGMAILRARMLDTEVVPLALWDGQPGDGPWGTASFVEHWRSKGLEPDIIDVADLLDGKTAAKDRREQNQKTSKNQQIKSPELQQEIKAMLFADVVGYSHIQDEEIPGFVEHFMGMVAEMFRSFSVKPLTQNTWGDALYFVFKTPEDAGTFALELRDRVRKTNWKKKGLPEGLGLRVSLHAGPLYRCKDPVIKKYKYTGSQVSKAARIEPITPPGQVYASEAFAALAAAQEAKGFALDYVGRVPLPKKSGIVPLYVVRKMSCSITGGAT
jgi:class 3 adenylate cyclase/tetratricopeptide (TPR) repeat protein